MKFGAMNNPMIDVTEEIALFSDLGFDYIDLTLEPDETYSGTISVKKITKALNSAGMTAVGHTAWYLPIASPFPEFRHLAIRELERCLKVFRDMGVHKMNLHPQTKVALHNEDWIIAQNVDALAELVDIADSMDMFIMLENMPAMSRASQLKPMMEAVPNTKLLLDVGHANLDTPFNRSEELLANWGDRLAHVHLSDNRGGHDDEHLPLGVGNINWLWVARLLKNVSYDDTVTIEVFGDDEDYLVMSRRKFEQLWQSLAEER